MEIDITELKKISARRATWVWGLAAILLLILGVIGRAWSPLDEAGQPIALTWAEWRAIQAERAYRAELDRLRAETDKLVEMLNASPDPVRAQINAERVFRQYTSGQAALERQRGALLAAATAVQDWAAGFLSHEKATAAVEDAASSMQPVEQDLPAAGGQER